MNKAIEPSMEAMDFKVNTVFAKKLTDLFQKVIDFRDNYKGMTFKDKVDATYKFFADNAFNQMIDLIEKYAGYQLEEVRAGFNESFCTFMLIADDIGTSSIFQTISAGTDCWVSKKPIKAKDLQILADSFNKKEGNIFPNMREKVAPLIRVGLYFDFPLAFFMKEMSGSEAIGSFTARELTAIILHEMGHTLTLIEHAADGYARMSVYSGEVNNFINNASVAEQMTFLKNMKAKNINGSVSLPIEFNKAVDNLSMEYDKLPLNDVDKIKEFIAPLIRSSAGALITEDQVFGFLGNTFKIDSKKNNQKVKYSDFYTTARDYYKAEVLADQYANRHGYGKELATGLDKLYKMGLVMYGDDASLAADANVSIIMKVLSAVGICVTWIFSLNSPNIGSDIYPPDYVRLKLIARDALIAIKNSNLPDKTVAYYIKTYEQITKVIESRPACYRYSEKERVFREILSYYCTVQGLYNIIVNGNIYGELNKLYTRLDNLISNTLYYYGAKFGSMNK